MPRTPWTAATRACAATGIDHRQLDVLNTERFARRRRPFSSDQVAGAGLDKNLELQQRPYRQDIAKERIDLAKTGHEPTLDLGAGLTAGYNDYKDGSATPRATAIRGQYRPELQPAALHRGPPPPRSKQAQFNYVAASEQLERSFPLGAEHGAFLLQQRERQHRLGARLQPVRHLRRQRPEGDRGQL